MNRGAVLGVLVFGIVLTVGAVAPGVAPVIVATPDSGSMSPTAETHSLVVVIDTEANVGDIALFETPSRDTPVLHRLVGTTENPDSTTDAPDAFVTQGDANGLSDQETGDPPVPRSAVYGTVPTIAGHPLVVPYAGIVLTNPVVGLGIWALLGISFLYSTTGGQAVRETAADVPVRIHVVVLALAVIVVAPIVTVGTPATVQTEILTTTTASDEQPHIVQPGEVGERKINVSSPVIWGVQTTARADGDLRITSVEPLPDGNGRQVTVQNEPSETPTVHRGSITVYSYPAVLPRPVLEPLAAIHPIVAAFASSLPIGGSILLGALVLIDPALPLRASKRAIRRRRRSESKPRVD